MHKLHEKSSEIHNSKGLRAGSPSQYCAPYRYHTVTVSVHPVHGLLQCIGSWHTLVLSFDSVLV